MGKKTATILGTLALILLLAGSSLLYKKLSKEATPGNFMVEVETEAAATEARTETETQAMSIEAETQAVSTGTEAQTENQTEALTESIGTEAQAESADTEAQTEKEPDIYPAPDFTVYDFDGNAFSLADFKGTPVILNFWASWCPPCKSEMPDFEEAYKTYGDQIQFMMINLTDGSQETVESASEYVESQGYTFPVFYDTDVSAAMAYSTSSIPASYFVNADGNLAAYAVGMIDSATLEKGVQILFPVK